MANSNIYESQLLVYVNIACSWIPQLSFGKSYEQPEQVHAREMRKLFGSKLQIESRNALYLTLNVQ